jgi:hypothetical protein
VRLLATYTFESRALFEAHNNLLPESSFSNVILLGVPLSSGQHVDSGLEERMHELQLLAKRLEHMLAHDSLYLLCNVLTAPRLMYILRATLCTNSLILPLYDVVIRDSLSVSLNVELDENRWRQASLPVRWGGLGVRGVVLLAPFAYLASAASTSELNSALLPPRLRDVKDSGIYVAL